MPYDGVVLPLIPWRGGLNTVEDPFMADPQQLSEAENIEFRFDGTRQKRGGVKKFNRVPVIDTET